MAQYLHDAGIGGRGRTFNPAVLPSSIPHHPALASTRSQSVQDVRLCDTCPAVRHVRLPYKMPSPVAAPDEGVRFADRMGQHHQYHLFLRSACREAQAKPSGRVPSQAWKGPNFASECTLSVHLARDGPNGRISYNQMFELRLVQERVSQVDNSTCLIIRRYGTISIEGLDVHAVVSLLSSSRFFGTTDKTPRLSLRWCSSQTAVQIGALCLTRF